MKNEKKNYIFLEIFDKFGKIKEKIKQIFKKTKSLKNILIKYKS